MVLSSRILNLKLSLVAGIFVLAGVVQPAQAYGIAIQAPDSSPSTAAPVFSTQAPLSGKIGETLVVLLPLVNTGTVTADSVQITSVSLGVAKLTSPNLPLLRGPYNPSDPDTLVLQFDAHDLTVGLQYLLTVKGTYQLNGHTLTFAVSLNLTVTVPSSSDQVELEHWVAIDAVSQKLQSLPGIDPAADNQELLTFVQSRPEFIDSGIDAEFSSVWATFANGEPYIIVNDRLLPANPSTDSQAAARAPQPSDFQTVRSGRQTRSLASNDTAQTIGVPISSKILFLNVFGSFGAADGNAINEISKWLTPQKYDPVNGTASVASLMNDVVDNGVLYFSTHGAVDDGGKLYALYTTDATTPALDEFFKDTDALGKTIVKMSVDQGRFDFFAGKWVPDTHYGITAAFVRKYFQFGANSFVYINACGTTGDNPIAADLEQAFFDADATVYAGWTAATDDTKASNTAKLIVDRLLGANQFALETLPTASGAVFKQRPFDWGSANNDAFLHFECPGLSPANGTKCGYDAVTKSFLVIEPNPKSQSEFTLLAPSISYMKMDEGEDNAGNKAQLTINGIFDSGQPSVMVGGSIDTSSRGIPVVTGGKDVDVVSWSPSQIVVTLPYSGLGSAGNVQVTVRDHVSNVAQLTEWRSQPDQVTFTLTGAGTLQQQQNSGLHLRADIRQWRNVIHDPPIEPGELEVRPIASANDSTATISSSGTATFAKSSWSWKGSDTLTNFFGSARVADNYFFLNGVITDSKHMTFALDDIATHGGTCTECGVGICTERPLFATGPFGWFSSWAGVPTYTDAQFETNGDSVSIKGDTMSASGIGNACGPTNDLTLRGNFNWATIPSVAGTAPDPESAS
jgi:hypothetical protein